jgi:hypothetical protein
MSAPDLTTFNTALLEAYTFPGTDAAVVFIAEGQIPSDDIQEVLSRSGQQRWYPVQGGHDAKVPWHYSKGYESLFRREEKGWDHEHCDFCESHVNIGETCWTANSGNGGFWIFCRKCYDKVPKE